MSRTRPLLLVAVALLSTAVTFAQTPGGSLTARPDRGVALGDTYSSSGVDSVSLTGGGLSLSIPLASLPPMAGGKLGVTITANYNSKLWDVGRVEALVTGTIGRRTFVVDTPRRSERGGWRIGGPGYAVQWRNAHEDFDYVGPEQRADTTDPDWQIMQGNRQWHRLYLITPDGAEHELVPSEGGNFYTGTERPYLNGSFSDTPDGLPTRYHTVDGTYLTFSFLAGGGWVVTAPDGTKATLSNQGQRIEDTSGNSILIYAGEGNATHYRDERSGREVRVAGSMETGYRISYRTVGDSTPEQHIYINTRRTRVRGKFYRVNSWNAAGQTEDGQQGVSCVHDAIFDTEPNDYNFTMRLWVVEEIVFPPTEPGQPGRKFTFSYNSDTAESFTTDYQEVCGQVPAPRTTDSSEGFGELSRMRTPTGAVYEYEYSLDKTHRIPFNLEALAKNMVTKRKVGPVDAAEAEKEKWTYQIHPLGGGGTVTNPDGTSASEAAYIQDPGYSSKSGGPNGLGGKVFSSRSGNVLVHRRWRANPEGWALSAPSGVVAVNPVVEAEFTSLMENNVAVQMSAKTYRYDLNGNLTQTKEYDWFSPTAMPPDAAGVPVGDPPASALLRQTDTSYYNSTTNPSSDTLYSKRETSGPTLVLNAPKETVTGASITRFLYDGRAYEQPPLKGNVTQVDRFDDQAGAGNDPWVTTKTTYDETYGNVTSTTDANNNVRRFYYEDDTHALPTKVEVDPQNDTGVQTTYTTYDFRTGLVTSTTDANGQRTEIDYTNRRLSAPDPFGRPGTVTSPAVTVDGVSRRRKVFTIYEDSLRRVTVESDLRAENDRLLKSRTTTDELGRSVLTERSEDGATYTIFTHAAYEQGGRVTYISNPMRSVEAATDGWSRVTKDATGRVREVASFVGADKPEADDVCDASTGCTGRVMTDYNAEFSTVIDQTGRARRSRKDGLGRLVRVDEPSGEPTAQNDMLGGYDAPTQPTAYTYDVLGNLTRVSQGGQLQNGQYVGGQTRTFTYSSLSRLASATNPESGTFAYEYDKAGNLTKRTDARGVVTTYIYDRLNRVTLRDYSDQTPDVAFTYEAAGVANSVGRLTQVSSSVSTYNYTGYDALGRVTSSEQVTANGDGTSTTYTMPANVYDLAGNLISQQYPTGRVVKSEYDAAGKVAGVKNNATGHYYAGGAADSADRMLYNAGGSSTAVKLGNGLWERTDFNSRLQLTQLRLGSVADTSSVLRLDFAYGLLVGGTLDTAKNNGNIQSQTITVPEAAPFVQTYLYDELNRLKSAEEHVGSTSTWRQVYTYDRYGNRNFVQGTTLPALQTNPNTSQLVSDPARNPVFDSANNRIKVTESGQDAYRYDEAGNLLCEPGRVCVQGPTSMVPYYVYDAENKMKSAGGWYEGGGTTYSYDGDGRRVKKARYNGEVTVFVYDALGRMVTEYSNQIETNGTRYLTQDLLGSTRVVTDTYGNAHSEHGARGSRHDYLPFGEELIDGQGGRTTAQGYIEDDRYRLKFTGYERDSETGLDYAQARYYASAAGRFTSPDPYSIVEEVQYEQDKEKAGALLTQYINEPQQWNRYVYVINNPLLYRDPTGETITLTGTAEQQRVALERIKNILGAERFALISQQVANGQIVLSISAENSHKLAGMGGNDEEKNLSRGFASLLVNPKTVEFMVTEKFSYKDKYGNVQEGLTANSGGGLTLPPAENGSGSGNWQIFVHPDAGKIATQKVAGYWSITGGQGSLVSNNEMIDAHEFGHVTQWWFPRMEPTAPGKRPLTDDVIFENAIKTRYPKDNPLSTKRIRH